MVITIPSQPYSNLTGLFFWSLSIRPLHLCFFIFNHFTYEPPLPKICQIVNFEILSQLQSRVKFGFSRSDPIMCKNKSTCSHRGTRTNPCLAIPEWGVLISIPSWCLLQRLVHSITRSISKYFFFFFFLLD